MSESAEYGKPPRPRLSLTVTGAAAQLVPMRPGLINKAIAAAPRGDGHPIIVLPCFLRSDRHTIALRRFLAGCGYAPTGWKLGFNVGPTSAAMSGCERLLEEVTDRHGGKASLIGHSLGGVLARELAKKRPELTRQLILLASPIRLPTASPLEPVYNLLSRWHDSEAVGSLDDLNRPPEIPVTAIYTRTDGIVAWESCVEVAGPQRESIAVAGAHGTMVRNPKAWRIVADRLAQSAGGWRPYETQNRLS